MSDDEIKAMATAVKDLLDQRDVTLRTQLADMRATCEALQTEVQALRVKVAVLPSEAHAAAARMVQTLGASLGAALPDAVGRAADRVFERRMATTRAAELEHAAPTGAAS
jgi:uncharacterized protein YlxW (UPF0749 family)